MQGKPKEEKTISALPHGTFDELLFEDTRPPHQNREGLTSTGDVARVPSQESTLAKKSGTKQSKTLKSRCRAKHASGDLRNVKKGFRTSRPHTASVRSWIRNSRQGQTAIRSNDHLPDSGSISTHRADAMEDIIEEPPSIVDPSSPSSRNNSGVIPQQSQPGAFREGGQSNASEVEIEAYDERTEVHPEAVVMQHTEENLVEAELVDPAVVATVVVPIWKTRRFWFTLVGIVLVCLSAVGIGLGVALNDSGTAQIETNLTWSQIGQDLEGEGPGSFMGTSITIPFDGSRVAVGETGFMNNTGRVTAFSLSNESSWDNFGQAIQGAAIEEFFGHSVAWNGKSLAVSAIGNDNVGKDSGIVRVFEPDGPAWQPSGMAIEGESFEDLSGYSISLSDDGSRLAISSIFAYGDDGVSITGHTRVFQQPAPRSNWVQLGRAISGEAEGDNSGFSISLSGDGEILAVGEPAVQNETGQVRVYSFVGSDWSQLGQSIVGSAQSDRTGWSVSLSSDGKILALGSPLFGGIAVEGGRAQVFQLVDNNWEQLGGDIDSAKTFDQLGFSLSLSGDGSTIAVGAPLNEDNGSSSGLVSVYRFDGTNWVQLGESIRGTEAGDQFGYSVAISFDGQTVAVGANTGGYARVYRIVEE